MSEAAVERGQDASARPRVGVSACLLGQPVRFNGGHSRSRFLTDELGPYVDWTPYCPEIEIGLGAPRETLRLTSGDRLVNRGGDADHTAAMAALPLPAGLDGYVFKAKSPTCGLHGIPRFSPRSSHGSGGEGQPSDHRGRGVFARRVTDRFPLLPAEDEGRLNDAVLREEFTERIFALARLRQLFAGAWTAGDLVAFHARHKLQLLAHDPARYGGAGRVVAAAGRAPRAVTETGYRDLFVAAMLSRATRGRHANTLQHAFSRIGRDLGRGRRADLSARIESYRCGADPLSVPVALLGHYVSDGDLPWLAGQTYLEPYPDALRLRHAVPR